MKLCVFHQCVLSSTIIITTCIIRVVEVVCHEANGFTAADATHLVYVSVDYYCCIIIITYILIHHHHHKCIKESRSPNMVSNATHLVFVSTTTASSSSQMFQCIIITMITNACDSVIIFAPMVSSAIHLVHVSDYYYYLIINHHHYHHKFLLSSPSLASSSLSHNYSLLLVQNFEYQYLAWPLFFTNVCCCFIRE